MTRQYHRWVLALDNFMRLSRISDPRQSIRFRVMKYSLLLVWSILLIHAPIYLLTGNGTLVFEILGWFLWFAIVPILCRQGF